MQNMTQSLHPAAEKGFSAAAALYQQARPSYPAEISAWLQQRLNLGPQDALLDLGAGTGKFLPCLKAVSANITAAEPVPEMLQQLRLAHPEVEAVQAFSNALPLPSQSVRAVFCAQSFHWFATAETLAEIHRILQQDGNLVLIWNQRDIRTGWVKALDDMLSPLEGDAPRCRSGQWKQAFEQQPWFKLEQEASFRQLHHGTVEQVVSKRLLSASFIAALPQAQQQALKLQFEQAVFERSGKRAQDEIDFPYITQVYVFKKTTEK